MIFYVSQPTIICDSADRKTVIQGKQTQPNENNAFFFRIIFHGSDKAKSTR